MFCTNCGKEIGASDAFCPNCGCNVEPVTKAKKQISINKKSVVVILGIIAAIALIIAVWRGNGVNASPENVAMAAVTSEYEADIDLMVKCFPDFTIRELAWEYGLSSDASRSEVKQKIKEAYRYTEPCEVRNLEAEVIDIYAMDENNFFRELYDDMTDEEYEGITQIAKVNLTFRVDGEAESVQATCIKMQGKWYLLRRT